MHISISRVLTGIKIQAGVALLHSQLAEAVRCIDSSTANDEVAECRRGGKIDTYASREDCGGHAPANACSILTNMYPALVNSSS